MRSLSSGSKPRGRSSELVGFEGLALLLLLLTLLLSLLISVHPRVVFARLRVPGGDVGSLLSGLLNVLYNEWVLIVVIVIDYKESNRY